MKIHTQLECPKMLPPYSLRACSEHHPALLIGSVQLFNCTAHPSQQPHSGLFCANHTSHPRTFPCSVSHCPGARTFHPAQCTLVNTTLILLTCSTTLPEPPRPPLYENLYPQERKQPGWCKHERFTVTP